jgi:hypothetical protein
MNNTASNSYQELFPELIPLHGRERLIAYVQGISVVVLFLSTGAAGFFGSNGIATGLVAVGAVDLISWAALFLSVLFGKEYAESDALKSIGVLACILGVMLLVGGLVQITAA